MKFLAVFITTPNRSVSEKLSKGLVRNKLAACVNRVPGLHSRYWWKGRIETAREELLIAKTVQSRLAPLTRWVKAHHPYTVCEVIALPLVGGNKDYFQWISKSLPK